MAWLNLLLLFGLTQTAQAPPILAEVDVPSSIPLTHQGFEQYGFSSGPDDLTPPYSSAQIRQFRDQVISYASTVEAAYPLVLKVLQPTHPVGGPITILISYRFQQAAAQTDGSRIRVNAAYAEDNPRDMGIIVHELVHVVQGYRADDPKWLVEGMADYVRYYFYEPGSSRLILRASTANYDEGYEATAGFLDWVVRNYDKDLIKDLNQQLYEGIYSDDSWLKLTGHSLTQLNLEWKSTLQHSLFSY
ncbi:MAG TPA: basic secretory protein-like protein [Fimbriimonadaceae bacterium]